MKVYIANPTMRRYKSRMANRLGPDHQLRFDSMEACADPAQQFEGIEVLVTSRFEGEWMKRFPSLRLLHASGTGVDKIDLAALPSSVRVCHTFGHGTSIAEYIVMVLLAQLRDLLPTDREFRQQRWKNPQLEAALPMPQVAAGKSVMILGTGAIGQATARLCRALGLTCVGVNRRGQAPEGQPFDQVLAASTWREALTGIDFLVVAVPLSPTTRGMVGREELSLLGPRGFLINVARGPVVEEEAIYLALKEGTLGGAALDVWYHYPPTTQSTGAPSRFPFHELPNVIMTPHISGVTEATFAHRVDHIADNIRALAEGRSLSHEIKRDVLPPRV